MCVCTITYPNERNAALKTFTFMYADNLGFLINIVTILGRQYRKKFKFL